MFRRRQPLVIVGVFGAWFGSGRAIYVLLYFTPEWVWWAVWVAGFVVIIVWFYLWLYSTGAPLRRSVARGRALHPDAEVTLVLLDPEWNAAGAPPTSWLVVRNGRVELRSDDETMLDVVAADAVSVATTYVTGRQLAVVLGARDAVWTFIPVNTRFGSREGKRSVRAAATRIRAALGLEVLDHVLD